MSAAPSWRADAAPAAYRACTRCLMDTSDPQIAFDALGVCNHCRAYDEALGRAVFRGEDGSRRLREIVDGIKRAARGRRYDCVIGLSGGVDSTYTALMVKKLGLRPLAVHLDNGWNSEISVRNIENIVKRLGIDLYTEVLDWEEFRRLQLAFLRASTPDSEIPTDHAIFATLYRVARRERIKWIIDGGNLATELMVPPAWSHGHSDWKYIRCINERFGGAPLRSYPHFTLWDHLVRIPSIDRLRRLSLLNYVDYDKPRAMEVIRAELGWEYYGGKHYESIYTRFYQGFILKEKFGFDKRRSHLSCLINAGNLTREEALQELARPAIAPEQLREDRAFVIKKLRISEEEFEAIMAAERKTFWDYPSYEADIGSNSARRPVFGLVRFARVLALGARIVRAVELLMRSPRDFVERLKRRAR
jgi:N-acetyl sugar amidotransferase